LEIDRNYSIELECYQRFKRESVTSIHGFAVPQLLGFDDVLQVIEMRIVTPPFILDFAKAYLDGPADFSEETWEEWETETQERFEGRWQQVKSLIFALQKFGIYYYDAKPQNITFPDHGKS
jgi:hypothetical protein